MIEGKLSTKQVQALFDILSHSEVYAEIEDFATPGTLSSYGPPFDIEDGQHSTSPSLQSLLSKFVLNLPGLRSVSSEFWKEQSSSVINDLQKAELSESYDKGSIGIRKTLASAISALIEYPVRGIFGGFDEPIEDSKDKIYDTTNSEDLQLAFNDFMHLVVYGDILDDMFSKVAETSNLADHKPIVQAAHEYGLINIASLMHFTLIMSPKGQQLLTLLDHVNKLVPYTIIRQTLKIGNVATMISAMTRVILAKMSVASVTNWIGITNTKDDGVNLLQEIISTVLHWDIRDFKSRASKIEKNKAAPSKEQLGALKDYLKKSRQEHEKLRETSKQQSKSMVAVILAESSSPSDITQEAHQHAQDYLAIQLSIRDREQIIQVLCHSHPDHLTQAIRDLVTAYDPMIRNVHEAVDLSETVWDLEMFLKDMIKLAKIPDQDRSGRRKHQSATVGDFVQLLKKHQNASHKFLHQCAKNGKEVTSWFHEYANDCTAHFRRNDHANSDGAGDLTEPLRSLFAALPEAEQKSLISILDQQALYLSKLYAASAVRFKAVVSSPSSNHPALSAAGAGSRTSSPFSSRTSSPARGMLKKDRKLERIVDAKHDENKVDPGPGAYLARWQELLDSTQITPEIANGGKVRGGGSGSVLKASASGVDDGLDQRESAQIEAANTGPAATPEDSKAKSHDNDGKDKSEEKPASKGTSHEHDEDDENDEEVFEEALESIDELGLREDEKVKKPDVGPVIEALLQNYRKMLGERNKAW